MRLWFSLNSSPYNMTSKIWSVSIPLWFSLNLYVAAGWRRTQWFPSHYGSRSTDTPAYSTWTGWNVSIPLWFSLNRKDSPNVSRFSGFHPTMVLAQRWPCKTTENAAEQFPSHYGSRSTGRTQLRPKSLSAVSIPLWFSLNIIPFENPVVEQTSFHPTMVLAQLIPLARKNVSTNAFPSHYGSRSTKLKASRKSSRLSFHPTMVLAQRSRRNTDAYETDTFPSHYGSRSTR